MRFKTCYAWIRGRSPFLDEPADSYIEGYKDGKEARQNMFEDAIRNRIAKLEKYSALLDRVIAIYERHEERERAGSGSTKFLENWPSGHGTWR